MLGSRAASLETLRQQITAIETGPAFRASGDAVVSTGLLATPRGSLHEVFTDTLINTGAALGFAFAQAKSLLAPGRQGILYLQLQSDALETGFPYEVGFKDFGLTAQQVVFVRPQTIIELLWAIEEAIACSAVAAVVADVVHAHKALDFTASRRMSLRAAASGASVLFVRYARDREASAARFRWKIVPELSGSPPFDERAPGPPRWRVLLEKGSLGQHRKVAPGGEEYLVDWSENGFVLADIESRRAVAAGSPRRAPLSHAASAALGDRLSEAS